MKGPESPRLLARIDRLPVSSILILIYAVLVWSVYFMALQFASPPRPGSGQGFDVGDEEWRRMVVDLTNAVSLTNALMTVYVVIELFGHGLDRRRSLPRWISGLFALLLVAALQVASLAFENLAPS